MLTFADKVRYLITICKEMENFAVVESVVGKLKYLLAKKI